MNKKALQELVYDIERAKNWETIHNLIMEYANDEIDAEMSNEDICANFDEDLFTEILSSIEHGEILDETDDIKRLFGLS